MFHNQFWQKSAGINVHGLLHLSLAFDRRIAFALMVILHPLLRPLLRLYFQIALGQFAQPRLIHDAKPQIFIGR